MGSSSFGKLVEVTMLIWKLVMKVMKWKTAAELDAEVEEQRKRLGWGGSCSLVGGLSRGGDEPIEC